jgi:hypothetical protein
LPYAQADVRGGEQRPVVVGSRSARDGASRTDGPPPCDPKLVPVGIFGGSSVAVPMGARRTAPLPPWFRRLFGISGAALVAVEATLHVAPGLLVGHGPWPLTALTVRTQPATSAPALGSPRSACPVSC